MTGRLTALLIVLLLAVAPAMAAGPSLVFDPASGDVISHERAGEPWYPASLTKLMTAYVVFEKLKSGALRLDQKIPVSPQAAKQPPSKIGTPAGNSVSVDMALQTMLVYSANDMAVVLAEAAGGSIPTFVRQMNETARKLGMTGSYFANPNGLFDERQVVTARDVGLLVSALLRDFPEHQHYFSQPFVKIGDRRLLNRNGLIRQMKTADGVKTGFVCNSGFNLVGSATQEGRRLVAVVFGAGSPQRRTELAQLLLESSFARPVAPPRPKLAALPNSPLGSLVPADMTETVCKGKNAINVARSNALGGWGFSLGRYETAQLANMALRGRMLGAREMMQGGAGGVVRLPGENGYAAMVWDLDQQASVNVCSAFRQQNIYCDVMTPQSFAAVGVLMAQLEAPEPKGDAAPQNTKKPKKKKKKK